MTAGAVLARCPGSVSVVRLSDAFVGPAMALSEKDARLADEARQIERTNRGWLVMWSAWRRTFTAFSCFSPGPFVVDEPTAERLLARMRHAELYYGARQFGRQKGTTA